MATSSLPAVGDLAPDFELPDADGSPVRLSSFRGERVVLFFYPRADTPGCTAQACALRDELPRFDDVGATILGISPDPVSAVRAFRDKFDLPYPLLADQDHAVAELYGVWGEKTMFGKTYMGVSRTTFLIDAAGRITRVFEKVDPATHAALVLEEIARAG